MAVYEAPRGVEKDLRFFLRAYAGGPLMDQYNFTDGLAHGQWPTVQFFTGPNGTGSNITAQVVKNIAGDTIVSATHKDPTATTGVWREDEGTYWDRVLVQDAIAFGSYYMRVSFKPAENETWTEDFEFRVTQPGDIAGSGIVTVDDVKRGWTTSLDDPTIEGLITDATEEVYGYLEARGISDPEALWITLGGMPRNVRRAIIARTRCMFSTFDLSSSTRVRSIQEGSEKITFASSKEGFAEDPCAAWRLLLDDWLRKNAPGRQPMIKAVTRRVGHTINDEGETNAGDAPLL